MPKEIWVHQEQLATKEILDHLDQLDQQGLLDQVGYLGLKETKVLLGNRVPQANKEAPDLQVFKDPKEMLVLEVDQVHGVTLVHVETPDQLVHKVVLGRPDCQVVQVLQVRLEHPGLLDQLETQVFKEHLEIMDNKDQQGLPDHLGHEVILVNKVLKDLKGQLEMSVLQASQDLLDQLDLLVQKEILDQPVHLALQVHLANLEHRD